MATLKAGTTVGGSPVLTNVTHNETGNPHSQYKLTTDLVAEYYNKTQTDTLLAEKVDLTVLPSLEQDKLDAQAAAAAASISETNAANSATSAATSASQASTSATNANTSASNAATSEANAATSELNAATSETNSDLNRGYAQEWANKAEDVLVSVAAGGNGTTDYSALHHAVKAAASASAASSFASSASASATSAGNSATAAAASQASAAVSEANAIAEANSSADSAAASLASAQDSEYWAGVAQTAVSNDAVDITYDDTTSGLGADNVQVALDNLALGVTAAYDASSTNATDISTLQTDLGTTNTTVSNLTLTVSNLLNTPTLTGEILINGRVLVTPNSSASDTVIVDVTNYITKTISANTTLVFDRVYIGAFTDAYTFILDVNHTGGTITWPASIKWPGDTAPTLTTNKRHLFIFVTLDGGLTFRGSALVDYAI